MPALGTQDTWFDLLMAVCLQYYQTWERAKSCIIPSLISNIFNSSKLILLSQPFAHGWMINVHWLVYLSTWLFVWLFLTVNNLKIKAIHLKYFHPQNSNKWSSHLHNLHGPICILSACLFASRSFFVVHLCNLIFYA